MNLQRIRSLTLAGNEHREPCSMKNQASDRGMESHAKLSSIFMHSFIIDLFNTLYFPCIILRCWRYNNEAASYSLFSQNDRLNTDEQPLTVQCGKGYGRGHPHCYRGKEAGVFVGLREPRKASWKM